MKPTKFRTICALTQRTPPLILERRYKLCRAIPFLMKQSALLAGFTQKFGLFPSQVNRGYKVNFDKQHFIGKQALQTQRSRGVTKKLIQLHLEAFESEIEMWPGGGEAIYRDGEYVG